MKNFNFLMLAIACLFSCSSSNKTVNEKKEQLAVQTAAITKIVDGAEVYKTNCLVCHGEDGTLMLANAKDLSISTLSVEERIDLITNGVGVMMPYKGILDDAAIKAVAEYSRSLKK